MFKPYHVYTHKRMLDAAVFVLESVRLPSGGHSLKIRWVNRRGLDLGLVEQIVVNRDQVGNWYELNN